MTGNAFAVSRDTQRMILNDEEAEMPKAQLAGGLGSEPRTLLKTIGTADAELATAARTRTSEVQASLTAFSRTGRTAPDYGVNTGLSTAIWQDADLRVRISTHRPDVFH